MKKLFLFTAAIVGSLSLFAQNTIKGKVVDAATGTPLANVSVSFSNGGGVVTDNNGSFTIDCSKTKKLTVSSIGFETAYQAIKNCDADITIQLQPEVRTLNYVEITTTSAQNKSILYQPSSITKLGYTELKRSTGLFLDDVINTNVPGVVMQRRAVSSGQQFNIRGYGNGTRGTAGVNSNFDNQGSKVYLNGIPITDAEGITVMDDIDFGSVGNVEVVKGPAGTLYGLAIAGVVNLRTIKPEKGKTSVGQEVIVGNYGLQRFTTHFQMGTERSSILLNYGHQESDGFFLHNASHKDFVNFAGDFQLNPKQSLTTYFGYSNSYDERAGELTIGQYDTLNYSGNPAYIKNNAHSEVISFRAGAGHTYNFNNHISNTTTVFGSGVNNNASSAGGWTDKQPLNYGLRSTFDTKFSLGNNINLNGITGVETQQQRAQVIGYAMIADSANLAGYNRIGAERSNQATVTGTTSVFTEWTLSLPYDFSVTAGIGVSNMKIKLDDRFYVAANNRANNAVPTRFTKTYDGMYSPHIALNKVFSKQFSLYAAYSKGYKAPVSSYFYIPYVTNSAATGKLNDQLVPEIGNQYEIGTKGALVNGRLLYELAFFDAVFSKKMTTVAVALNPPSVGTAYSYVVNGGKQDDKGIEASVKFAALQKNTGFFRSVNPFVNFTYSDFTYKNFTFQRFKVAPNTTKDSTVDYSGKAVAGVAPYVFNAGVDMFTAPGIYANATFNYKDAMPITSDGLYETKSYSLLNAKLGIRRSLSKHFDLDVYGGATNITGEHYYYMVFVNQLPDAYLPAPLKTVFFGGLNLKYNF